MNIGGNIDKYITGDKTKNPVDTFSDADRLPSLMLVDTSASMKKYSDILKQAVVNMIEKIAENSVAKNKVDLEIVTFDTVSQVNIKIPSIEVYKLIDSNNKLKKKYEEKIDFDCRGGTPTALALDTAVEDLRERYEKLKNHGKAPKSPILFILSDGEPCVAPDMKEEHDQLLVSVKAKIKQLVKKYRLVVIAVEVGDVCKPPSTAQEQRERDEMHRHMQDFTGLDNKHHVCQAKDDKGLEDFFKFTSSLLVASCNRAEDTSNLNNKNVSASFNGELR